MKELSDYFRLKEIDRIEAEKQATSYLKKVINICLKKGFHFSYNPTCDQITVSTDVFKTTYDCYVKGNLLNHKSTFSIPIKDLFELLSK